MIYLIGGPPRCGKTTAARRLARQLGCSSLPGDWLTQAFSMYVPDSELLPVELLELAADVPRASRNDEWYARFSPDQIVRYYRAWAERTWPGLHTLLEYALHDGEDLIVEGYQVDPSLVPRFLDLYPARAGSVRTVFLVRQDDGDAERSIKLGAGSHDWVLTRTSEDATFGRIARMIVRYGEVVRADAERSGYAVFSVDHDFERRVECAVECLLGPCFCPVDEGYKR